MGWVCTDYLNSMQKTYSTTMLVATQQTISVSTSLNKQRKYQASFFQKNKQDSPVSIFYMEAR